jgi:membrane protease YdiL (CAAX protease family)
MESSVDRKRLYIFLGFAFGIAWIVGLIIYLTGGLAKSPEIIPGSNITLAVILEAFGYMWAPALAHIFTRLVTRPGWHDLWLKPYFKNGWKYWLAGWFGPGVLTIVGIAVYFLFFPGQFDGNLTSLRSLLDANPTSKGTDPWLIVIAQTLSAFIMAPVINSFFTFGEEFGWRGYLLPLLLPLGEKKAYLLSGIIWGLWHAPVIAMGHNYGLEYAGFPWLGILAMIWFCILCGTFLGWASLRAGSVWPAVIGHAALNGIAALGMLFVAGGKANNLLGPIPVGVIGSIGFLIAALLILINPGKNPE